MEHEYRGRRPRALRARGTAPAWAVDEPPAVGAERTVFPVVMAGRGRVVLPAEVRKRLNIKEGDRLALIVDPDGSIRLQTLSVTIASLQGAFKDRAPGRILSDELIAERRAEAAKEERESRAYAHKQRRRRRKSV